MWWSWIPGFRKLALARSRREALSSITGEQLFVERMAQRPRFEDDSLDEKLRDDILGELNKIYTSAQNANNIDDLDDLIADAELQGIRAAYLCPASELKLEGDLVLDQIDGWGIPKEATNVVRTHWKNACDALTTAKDQIKQNVRVARGALHALFGERDLWGDYLDDEEDDTNRTMRWLFVVILIFLPAAVFAVYSAPIFSPFLVLGILAAGLVGSCASITSKMPTLDEKLSRKTDASGKTSVRGGRVLARIATGLIGSIVGSALLSWIPLSIEGKSFGDLVNLCTKQPCSAAGVCSCTTVSVLILLGVPTLLGFSERTLLFFEERFFGHQQRKKQRRKI
jgi:hypothetical protein